MDTESSYNALTAMLNGYRSTALIHLAAELRIADLLADRPQTAQELAAKTGTLAQPLERVLRGLVVLNVCREEGGGRFSLGELGEFLRTDHPRSLRGFALLCGEEYVPAWAGLRHSVDTGGTAFDHAFGMSVWQHRGTHPELRVAFDEWLAGVTAGLAQSIVSAFDFSPFATIADIAGGDGALLSAVLTACPASHGVLFEQPGTIASAKLFLESMGVADRCEFVAGDFFNTIGVQADALVLKSVIHDWDEDRAVAILRNCRAALDAGGKLLLIERLRAERSSDDPHGTMLDLHMMAVTGGRERKEAEFRTLLNASGFEVSRIVPTSSGFHIFEGKPH